MADPALCGVGKGISTIGFRTAKYTPCEWAESNYTRYHQAFADRDTSERQRHEAHRTMLETDALTRKNQHESTKRLSERLHDVTYWKTELEREIRDMIEEISLLCAQKKRLENSLMATEVPLYLAQDNLESRTRRENGDLVDDAVERQLLNEVRLINNVQALLAETIKHADKQLALNREAKQLLEMDWSDKKEAEQLDSIAGHLKNEHTNKQFFAGCAKFDAAQTSPESWAQFSHSHIVRAEHERMASIELRTLIDNVLQDISRDMRAQADAVERAMTTRLAEVEDSRAKLTINLKNTVSEIARQEKNIEELRAAIRAKEDPMKVANTRLDTRSKRPGAELCRDPPQYKLIEEVKDLNDSVEKLICELEKAQLALKNLEDTRACLENDLRVKTNSAFIEREKCSALRTRFPPVSKLQGY